MSRRFLVLSGILFLSLLAPSFATAQKSEPTVYTYVALWGVPRDKWADFEANAEKNSRPVLERMLADGTIMNWGISTRIVHEEGGNTHSLWWAATSIAGIEKVREELIKLPNPAGAGAKHEDLLFQSITHRGRTTAPTSGYLYVSFTKLKPGMGRAWEALGKKYFEPVLDDLLAKGTILGFDVASEYVHTQDPDSRALWYITPSAEADDKVNAAFEAVWDRDGAALIPASEAVAVRSEHRDSFWRFKAYAHK
jgi:hypothetical protein